MGLQDRILQEQSPGACAQAPSQMGAQSGRQHSPTQLVDGKLAGANKAKAASQVESPMPGMSLLRLPFATESLFHQILIRRYLD
jgi:hypothetical protein